MIIRSFWYCWQGQQEMTNIRNCIVSWLCKSPQNIWWTEGWIHNRPWFCHQPACLCEIFNKKKTRTSTKTKRNTQTQTTKRSATWISKPKDNFFVLRGLEQTKRRLGNNSYGQIVKLSEFLGGYGQELQEPLTTLQCSRFAFFGPPTDLTVSM